MAEPHNALRCSSSIHSHSCPIEGMESVIASVSGYHGTERLNLVKLISHAGASYVGSMSSSITHLVCWKFEGRKYDIAMNSETIVVNHRWIEDCVKQGKRVPEHPYTLKCGQEMGPLLLEVPQVPKFGALAKKQKVLSDKLNTCHGSEKRKGYRGLEASGDAVWTCSSLLNQNLFPDVHKLGHSSHKSKNKLVNITSEQERPLSGPLRNQCGGTSSHSSMELARRKLKGKIFNNSGSNKPETSRRRRLIKKGTRRDILDCFPSDSDQDCYLVEVDNLNQNNEDIVILSNPLDGETYANVPENGQTPTDGFFNCNETRNQSLDAVEADVPTRLYASTDPNEPNVHAENALTAIESTSEDGCAAAGNSKKETIGLETKHDSIVPSSMELSCVICLTDFSSTRGVLPCGHRFCYSCIESWADHMASRRKISTCPLCKESFASIIKFEDANADGQKIYSQSIPCGLSTMDMFILHDQEIANVTAQNDSATLCSVCRRLEPVDLLIICNVCQIRRIHSYCLDPPVDPWTCIDCKDLQRLLPLSR